MDVCMYLYAAIELGEAEQRPPDCRIPHGMHVSCSGPLSLVPSPLKWGLLEVTTRRNITLTKLW